MGHRKSNLKKKARSYRRSEIYKAMQASGEER